MCYNSSMTRILSAKQNHLITLNLLATKFSVGNVLTSEWLKQHGISSKLAWWYMHSGWLERIGREVYKKTNTSITWSNAVAAIQSQLNLPVHVGGKTALEILGMAHFVPVGGLKRVILFAKHGTKLPKWLFDESVWGVKFNMYQPLLFTNYEKGVERVVDNNKILISPPELAILEVLHLVPSQESFEGASLLMQGLAFLRPSVVQQLLESCRSIKAKKLFLHLASIYQHKWLNDLDLNKVFLGSGKCVVDGGGSYDGKYKISVPVLDKGY